MFQVIQNAGEHDEIEALVQARDVMSVRQAVVDLDVPDLADLFRLIEESLLDLGADDTPRTAQLCLQGEIAGIGSDIEHGQSGERLRQGLLEALPDDLVMLQCAVPDRVDAIAEIDVVIPEPEGSDPRARVRQRAGRFVHWC